MSDMSDSNESWLIHQREQASERSSYESELTSRLRQQSTDDANTINALRETIERLTKEQRNDVDTINQLRLKKDAATARAERLETELRNLTPRCDGAEGVRADGSNIDTTGAHAALGDFQEEPK